MHFTKSAVIAAALLLGGGIGSWAADEAVTIDVGNGKTVEVTGPIRLAYFAPGSNNSWLQAAIKGVEDAIATEGWTNVEAHQIGYDGPDVSDVDRFLIVNVWHHLEGRPVYATALGEALADGGRIVVVEYDMEAEPGPPMEMRLLPEQVIADFEAAGFDAELLPVTLPRQYMVVATPSE